MSQVQLQNLGAIVTVHIYLSVQFSVSDTHGSSCETKKLCEFSWTGLQSREREVAGGWARKLWWVRLPLASPTTRSASPQTLTSSSCQSLRFLSEESGRWPFIFQYWKEQIVNISSEYIQIMSWTQGVQDIVSFDSAVFPGFCWRLPSVLKAELMALWLPWSHSRDFSEESRCDDNHWRPTKPNCLVSFSDFTVFSLSCS